MDYIIATMHQAYSKTFLEFGKYGKKYRVTYRDGDDINGFTSKDFDTSAKAAEVYLKIAGWILLGAYSDSDRRRFLLTGTMK